MSQMFPSVFMISFSPIIELMVRRRYANNKKKTDSYIHS